MAGSILLFIPAYNCAPQVGRVLDQAEAAWVRAHVAKVIVVDNRSPDETAAVVAERIRRRGDDFIALLRNEANYGLGGSHKVAFRYAQQHGFDWVIVLHGDDQGTLADLRPHLEDGSYERVDCLLGSRFMPGARLAGYSALRRLGNAAFNALYSLCLGKRITDLGSGLNLYRVAALSQTNHLLAPDNLTFNCVLLASQVIAGCRVRFVPISWREDDQVSNVKLVRQAMQTLRIALRALFRRGAFLDLDHRERPVANYAWAEVHAGA
jgi:glycosyltransferase involved in cell wall biosynthesis